MLITASELRMNFGKYLALAEKQDIYITKNGKPVAKLTSASANRAAALDSLVGIVQPETAAEGNVRDERLARQ